MNKKYLFIVLFSSIFFSNHNLSANEFEFSMMEKRFKNFVSCELTRTEAINHFGGQPFKITMIDLFDIQSESDLKIVTGAIKCFVNKTSKTLYVAVGTKTILEKEQVVYYTIRENDFSILATELIKFPYKERCKWSAYWVDIN